MESPINFIVTPKEQKLFKDTKMVAGVELCVSTSIEEAIDTNRNAIVVSLPQLYKGEIKVGDEVIIHHNTFRMYYDDSGNPVHSNNYIRDNMFYVEPELVFMVVKDGKYIAIDENVFVKPEIEDDFWEGKQEKQHVGIVKFSNNSLRKQGITEGDRVCFRRSCEYEFSIDGEKLFLMANKRILAKLN